MINAPTPQVPPLPDPLPSAPTYASGGSKSALGNANRPGSVGTTIMTSPLGAPPAPTAGKSLLGQ